MELKKREGLTVYEKEKNLSKGEGGKGALVYLR